MEISPWEHRRIRYLLDFALHDGTQLHFDGTKRISYLRPFHSWTTLPGLITHQGRPWARALLRFPPRTLPAFVASFTREPRPSRSLRGFSAAVLGGDGDASRLTDLLGRLPRGARVGLRAGMAAVDGAAVVLEGRRLADLDAEGREAVLHRIGSRPILGRALDTLKIPVVTAHAAGDAAAEVLERNRRHPLARPEPPLDVTPSTSWPSISRADVVVIGSGAGGAMAARALARAGLDTVIVEEGDRNTSEDFRTRPPLERYTAMYRDGGVSFAVGRPPVLLPIGRAVGGTTVVNAGTCYRTPEGVLRRWRDRHGLGLADPEAFAPYLNEVELTLEVAPAPLEVLGRNGGLALRGAEALGWSAAPLRRTAPGCGGCCQCIVGCPRNAKGAVHLNALPDACAAGARIVARGRVERILHSRGRAEGVLVRRPNGTRLRILAPRVMVAAGATETPPLLRRSGLGGHPRVGRNLALHPAVSVLGRFAEPVKSWKGVLQSVGVDEFHRREGILLEATSAPQGLGAPVIPGYGRRFREGLADAAHLASIGAMVADAPAGRVLGRRRAFVSYDLMPRDGRRLLRAIELSGRLLLAAGAEEVLTGIPGAEPVRTARDLVGVTLGADHRRLRVAAFHPTGTVAAGADRERAPADTDGRLRGTRGIWIADASVLPSCPAVNPQVTIMAVALAIADGITAVC